jgi:hypothetical protein
MVDIAPTRIRKGLVRLLKGPSDLDRWDGQIPWKPLASAPADHRQLFEAYCAALESGVRDAVENWNGELHGWAAEGHTPDEAKQTMWETYPAGPAAFPPFVALVRCFWLRCDGLNRRMPAAQGVRPEQFMLDWLRDDPVRQEAVAVLAAMPYWPIGMDAQGNWI